MWDSFVTVRLVPVPSGDMNAVLIRAVLTNLGEKMSDEEVDELLKAVDTSSGEINYTGAFPWFGLRQTDRR